MQLILPEGAVLGAQSGIGIVLDPNAPDYGWHNMLGAIDVRGTGPNDPDFVAYGATAFRAYRFSATGEDEIFIGYHIPHDYVPGSAVFLHTADVHYQSTNLATKNKAPNFYGV